MKFFRYFLNPLMVFIGIQLAWVLVVAVWLYWFLGSHRKLRALAEKYSPELLKGGLDWIILFEGLILLVAILAGVYVIFLYWTKQAALYKEEKAFVSRVTHEFKSPLASLQLHLETMRLRRLSTEQRDAFLNTMLDDTARLRALINNLLSANRLEKKGLRLALRPCNFSRFVEDYFRKEQGSLPQEARLTLEIAPDIHANIEAESFEMALGNLLENAVLYAGGGPPIINVKLAEEGKQCHLIFSDRGRGIERKEQKKVFRMFYRARRSGEAIRGFGLGLFIVKAMVRRHKGKVWLESEGEGKGTTFHILLPRIKPNSE
jgi:signal transduction histidine kinase